ncbi:hypothetical protein [Candidatus Symbiopectobacterium sp.]|nr:hypothetical protein [Candidatus Symbiopectobacterium sp.]
MVICSDDYPKVLFIQQSLHDPEFTIVFRCSNLHLEVYWVYISSRYH